MLSPSLPLSWNLYSPWFYFPRLLYLLLHPVFLKNKTHVLHAPDVPPASYTPHLRTTDGCMNTHYPAHTKSRLFFLHIYLSFDSYLVCTGLYKKLLSFIIEFLSLSRELVKPWSSGSIFCEDHPLLSPSTSSALESTKTYSMVTQSIGLHT